MKHYLLNAQADKPQQPQQKQQPQMTQEELGDFFKCLTDAESWDAMSACNQPNEKTLVQLTLPQWMEMMPESQAKIQKAWADKFTLAQVDEEKWMDILPESFSFMPGDQAKLTKAWADKFTSLAEVDKENDWDKYVPKEDKENDWDKFVPQDYQMPKEDKPDWNKYMNFAQKEDGKGSMWENFIPKQFRQSNFQKDQSEE